MFPTPPPLDGEPPIDAREDLEDEEEDTYDREVITFARLLQISSSALHEITLNSYILPRRHLSRRLDRCDRMIQNESRDPNGGNVCLSQLK